MSWISAAMVNLVPERITGMIFKILTRSLFITRFLYFSSDPELFEKMSEKKALSVFHQAYTRNQNYLNFLRHHSVNERKIISISDYSLAVPETSKELYIKNSGSLKDICFSSSLSDIGIIYESSGYSGEATSWPVTKKEEIIERRLAAFGLDLLFNTHSKKSLIINTFALGSWIAGIGLMRMSESDCAVLNVGTNVQKGLQALNKYRQMFDQFIIAGYPPFIKKMIESQGMTFWEDIPVHLLLGGEGIPEEYRDYIWKNTCLKSRIYSIYGASEIGIAGVTETEDSVKIRRRACSNRSMQACLFGSTTAIPMLFQYDPTTYFIETNDKNELIFTKLSDNSAIPVVRYNIKDYGGVISYRKMETILKKFAPDIILQYPVPFLYVHGRVDGSLNFFGSVIYPETISSVLYQMNNVTLITTGSFKLSVPYDKRCNPVIHVAIQLKQGIEIEDGLKKSFEQAIGKKLFEKHDDLLAKKNFFRDAYPEGIVQVSVYKYDEYPYRDGIKLHYV